MIGCQTSRVTSGSLRCVSTCCDVFMPSRPRVCAIRLQTELSASHFLRDRPVTHTRSHVAPLHPQLAFCSTRCRAGSHSRVLALTLHAHNLPNASCVTGTARGSLRCVCVHVSASRACVCGCALPCSTTRIGAQRINPTIRPMRSHHTPLRWRTGSCPRPILP